MFCHTYQWRIEKERDDHGRIKDAELLRHLEKCSVCQGWLTSLAQVERQLKTASTNLPESHLQQIQTAVLQYLSHSKTVHLAATTHKRYIPHHIRYAITAAAAAVVVAIGLFSLFSPESENLNQVVTMESVEHVPKQLQYQIPILARLPEQMMETEMQNMEMGIRDALGFFQNCLPQGLIAANLESENKAG